MDLENKAATVEGAFILQPPKCVKQALPALPADMQPTVGVSVTLRREEVTQQVHARIVGILFFFPPQFKQVLKLLSQFVIKCICSHFFTVFILYQLPLVELKINLFLFIFQKTSEKITLALLRLVVDPVF